MLNVLCKSPQLDLSPCCRCIIYVPPHNDGHVRAYTLKRTQSKFRYYAYVKLFLFFL